MINPETAQRCDCGYNFAAKTAKEAFLDCSTRPRWKRRAAWGARILLFTAILGYFIQDVPVFIHLRRPSNTPKDAVYIRQPKMTVWEHCNYNSQQDADYCQVWSGDGGLISNEVYLPWDGGPPIKAEHLKIQEDVQSGLGREAICLENGRTLIPKWLVDARKEGRFRDMDSLDPGCRKIRAGT